MSWLGEEDWGNRAKAEAAEAALAAQRTRQKEAEYIAAVWKKNDERNKRLADEQLREL